MSIKSFDVKLPRGWRLSFCLANLWGHLRFQVCVWELDGNPLDNKMIVNIPLSR